ncbi:TPA: AAA family ATPase [Streptococcus suis]
MLKQLKLVSIEISNIKNVQYGVINFKNKNEISHLTGIYGQNGSGKTSVINAVSFIKDLVEDSVNKKEYFDMLTYGMEATIKILFDINNYGVEYSVTFEKIRTEELGQDVIVILKESLITNIESKKTLIDFWMINDTEFEVLPRFRFPITRINTAKFSSVITNNRNKGKSFIFSQIIREYIESTRESKTENRIKEIYKIISKNLANNIFIYSNQYSGMINMNTSGLPVPLHFYYEGKTSRSYGVFPLNIQDSFNISEKEFRLINHVFKQINTVLPKIIPELTISLKELRPTVNDKGENELVVQVISNRNGKSIPFRSESDGIKKLVSILSSLINAYSSKTAIILIDELDSGIFEFLLGEILDVLSKGAKGQIIFTSHNLRPLEILEDDNIVFTTINPQNRYVRKTTKETNNLRNVYIREIQVNSGPDAVYDSSDLFLIQRAFRQAGKLKESESTE